MIIDRIAPNPPRVRVAGLFSLRRRVAKQLTGTLLVGGASILGWSASLPVWKELFSTFLMPVCFGFFAGGLIWATLTEFSEKRTNLTDPGDMLPQLMPSVVIFIGLLAFIGSRAGGWHAWLAFVGGALITSGLLGLRDVLVAAPVHDAHVAVDSSVA